LFITISTTTTNATITVVTTTTTGAIFLFFLLKRYTNLTYILCVLEFVTREDARDTLESELGDWGPRRVARGKFYKILILL